MQEELAQHALGEAAGHSHRWSLCESVEGTREIIVSRFRAAIVLLNDNVFLDVFMISVCVFFLVILDGIVEKVA